jgi:hypothetical protein
VAYKWLSINSTDLSVSTDSVNDIGNYTVTIEISYESLTGYVYVDRQEVNVRIFRLNTAPYFKSEIQPSFEIYQGAAWTYTLPAFSDDEGNKVTVHVDKGAAATFLQFYQNKL